MAEGARTSGDSGRGMTSGRAGGSLFIDVLAWVFMTLSGLAALLSAAWLIALSAHGPAAAPPAVGEPFLEPMRAILLLCLVHLRRLCAASTGLAAVTFACALGLLFRWNWARLCFIGLMVFKWAQGLALIALLFFFPDFARAFLMLSPAVGVEGERMLVLIPVTLSVMAFLTLYAWVAAKLVSKPVRREFVEV